MDVAAGQGTSAFHWRYLQFTQDKEKTEFICSLLTSAESPLPLFTQKVRFLREIQVPPQADISQIRTCRFTSVARRWLRLSGSGLPATAALDKAWHCAPCPETFPGSEWMNAPAAATGIVP